MKLAAICSSGGSAFFAAVDIALRHGLLAPEQILLITDRECGAEVEARARAIASQRIVVDDNMEFSRQTADSLQKHGAQLVLLYFSRLITEDLFHNFPSLNIHPSLLPAFRGFGAIKQALELNVKLMGSTLHLATADADAGPIVAQTASPILDLPNVQSAYALSFVQKCYLSLCAIDLMKRGDLTIDCKRTCYSLRPGLRVTPSAAPALQSAALIAGFRAMLATRAPHEGVFQP